MSPVKYQNDNYGYNELIWLVDDSKYTLLRDFLLRIHDNVLNINYNSEYVHAYEKCSYIRAHC